MSSVARRTVFLVIGIVLLLTPLLVRTIFLGYNQRPYAGTEVPTLSVAATPIPTLEPAAPVSTREAVVQEVRPGPIIVDLAHGNRLNRSSFQPLASALAKRGVGLRFWLTDVNILEVQSFLDFPDQSDELSDLLADASGLVVISPFFLWSPQEIAVAEQFVADGGRLLLISDPDAVGDVARDINNLAEPFGGVFNDDYLYDTSYNDGNFVFIFLDRLQDDASELSGSEIALYGARSISGDIKPQAHTAATTLSSVRTGQSPFTALALAGLEERDTAGHVLLMSDFDALTEPYVQRHDNRALVDHVAGFLAGAERRETVVDFPNFLGREIVLVFGDSDSVDARLLRQGANLQRTLRASGRDLQLSSLALLTNTLTTTNGTELTLDADVIYVGQYEPTAQQTDLMRGVGITYTKEIVDSPTLTPTLQVAAPVTPSVSADVNETSEVADTEEITANVSISDTLTPTMPVNGGPAVTPTPEPTPAVKSYLMTDDGLRLLASETVIIVQLRDGGKTLLAVLADDPKAVSAGLDRLLTRDYEGCIVEPMRAFCPYEGNGAPGTEPSTSADTEKDAAAITPEAAAIPIAEPGGEQASILLIDDNDKADASETSEADTYLQVLTQLGYAPDLWSTSDAGTPSGEDMLSYAWVIWSGAGYESSGPEIPELESIFSLINEGGRLTISSRRPFFGASMEDPSVISDVVTDQDVPALVVGLPDDPMQLANGLPPVAPLEAASEEPNGPQVALRRGPDSNDSAAPLLFTLSDEGNEPDATGARLLVLGMSVAWLPDGYDALLVENMATWMLAE